MTSEGQQAGQQPGATGSGADPFGADGFPPDSDGQPTADRPPSYPHAQESFPSAYAPPPHTTPNGGSPFVVPAVPPAAPGSPAPQSPGPAFGPGAAKFSSSGSARVPVPDAGGVPQRSPAPAAPEPGLPQRQPTAAAPSGTFPVPKAPQSAWAPPPAAPPSAAPEDNPFAPHPYRNAAGDLPQRSPGVAGGPLGGPVGDFNGFAPTRQPADPAPPAGQEMPRRIAGENSSPFDRPDSFGVSQADQPPADDVFGAAAQQPFGSARPDDDAQQPSGRAPGVSAFGDQRVRVPGATLTGLPDAPTTGSDSGGFPLRGAGDGSSRGSESSGGFPLRGGTGNGSFPIRGSSGAGESSSYAARVDPDSGAFAAGQAADGPFAQRSGPFAAADEAVGSVFAPRGEAGSSDGGIFAPRGEPDGGAFAARSPADSGGFPVRAGADAPPFGADPGDPQSSPYARAEAPRFDAARGNADLQNDGGNDYAQRVPGASFSTAGPPDGAGSGYAQRVPGASFSGGAPVVAEPRAAAVPQPRDPSEQPDAVAERSATAKGTARPVSASASVPMASRVAPPAGAEELPPAPAAPQPRVYGRPAPADEVPAAPESPYQDESRPVSGGFGAAPTSGSRGTASTSGTYGQPPETVYGQPAESPYGRPPAESSDGTYGRPAETPFGTPPSSGPFGPADAQPDERPRFGSASPEDPYAERPPAAAFGAPAGTSFDGVTPSSGAPDPAPGGFGAAPTSGGAQPPARASGRATASARVSPPGQPFTPPAPVESPDERGPVGFSEFTTDIAGRGRPGQPGQPGPVPGNPAARTTPPDQYTEHTTDVSGRNQAPEQPYVPAPALPSMHAAPPLENGFPPAKAPEAAQPFGERPRMGGVFPGPASRATVTPPGPEQTASWPSRPEQGDAEQGRFDSFKPDAPEKVSTEAAKPETPHVRMLPVILGVILGAGLIVGLTLGITWLIARGSHEGGTGISVSAGDCVKREGDAAVTANCDDAGSFEVTAVVDTKEKCPDLNQPYVVNPTDNGRTQVLCLKPRT